MALITENAINKWFIAYIASPLSEYLYTEDYLDTGIPCDMRLIKIGVVFSTKEEAIAKAKQMLKVDEYLAEIKRLHELQEFAQWLTGCGYDFCQHEYFVQNRHLLCSSSLEILNGGDDE